MVSVENIERLKAELEKFVGRKIQTPKDFEYLSLHIFNMSHQHISVSTLKRLWGYVGHEQHIHPRTSTLGVLTSMLGYRSWEDFCNRVVVDDGNSGFLCGKVLLSKFLQIGEELRILWSPARVVTVKYDGSDSYTIVDSVNSKLSVGDTFLTPLFAEGEPAYLHYLRHDGMPPCTYVCGRQGGVKIVRLIEECEQLEE